VEAKGSYSEPHLVFLVESYLKASSTSSGGSKQEFLIQYSVNYIFNTISLFEVIRTVIRAVVEADVSLKDSVL
jgi:hypothetical protein